MTADNRLWKLEPHTVGKHLVLRRYLDAWFPIMGSSNERILFIDGFAGPGEYRDGEEGSPIIAIRSLVEHRSKGRVSAAVHFLLIEKDRERALHLSSLIERLIPTLPRNCTVKVLLSTL
jgi:three-Cys-motif partner protein